MQRCLSESRSLEAGLLAVNGTLTSDGADERAYVWPLSLTDYCSNL